MLSWFKYSKVEYWMSTREFEFNFKQFLEIWKFWTYIFILMIMKYYIYINDTEILLSISELYYSWNK